MGFLTTLSIMIEWGSLFGFFCVQSEFLVIKLFSSTGRKDDYDPLDVSNWDIPEDPEEAFKALKAPPG